MNQEYQAFEPPRDRSGTVLVNKYRLEALLGEGGMASVYRARHRNGNLVAIKILHRVLSVDRDIRDRFLHEGYAANAAGHAGAVQVLDDAVAEDGSVFLVMEYLDGASLAAISERKSQRLCVDVVFTLAHGLLDILATSHENRIIHRDIKPENVFVTRAGQLKLLDFGIARVPLSLRSLTPTQTGALLGTPAFMSPEQARGDVREINEQSDVYGVGTVMFSLLTGQHVFPCTNPTEYVIKTATQRARSLADVAPETPPDVVHIVDKALAFEKESRWGSAAEMRDAIAVAQEQLFGAFLSKEQLGALVAALPNPQADVAMSSTTPASGDGEGQRQRTLPRRDQEPHGPTLAAVETGPFPSHDALPSENQTGRTRSLRWLWSIPALVAALGGGFLAAVMVKPTESAPEPAAASWASDGIQAPADTAAPSASHTDVPAPIVDIAALPEPSPSASAAPPASAESPPARLRPQVTVPTPRPRPAPPTSAPTAPPTSAPTPPPRPTGEPEGFDPYLFQ